MKKQLVGMNLVTSLLVLAMAVFAVVGLSIPVATEYSSLYYYSYETRTFNGFNTLLGDNYLMDFSGAIAGVNWLLLISGLTCIVLAALAMCVFSAKTAGKAELAVVIIAIITAFLYMVEGIAMVSLWRGGDGATTTAFVVFIIQALLLTAYFICRHYAETDENVSSLSAVQTSVQTQYVKTAPKSNMANAATELTKYKQLLDMGAITQEEFDAKKKELLNLE